MDIADILETIPSDIVKQVKTRVVSQCVELFNQPTVDWTMQSNWAEVVIGLLTNHSQHVGE